MLHRIREAWTQERTSLFSGPVEVDETHVGGKRKNMASTKRKQKTGRGAVSKAAVVGAKDRESNQVAEKSSLQGFVIDHAALEATVYA